jgi:hypothetical protein
VRSVSSAYTHHKIDGSRVDVPDQVALIMPGAVETYQENGNDWGVLKTPNSAAAVLGQVDRAYIGCPLSMAWPAPDKAIELWARPRGPKPKNSSQ